MKTLLFTLLILATTLGLSYAQYSEVDHDTQQILIGTTGVNDTVSTAATVILPFDEGDYQGWLGLYYQQTTANGEVVSDIRNGRAEGGVDIGIEGMSINAFGEINSDKEKGIDRQLQVGGFVRYEFEGVSEGDAVGIGNFLENEAALDDLGIKAEDLESNVVRGLAYYSTRVGNLSVLVEGKPNVTDPADIKLSLEPKYVHNLSDTISVVASAIVDLDTRPLIEDNNITTQYSLQLGATW